MQAFILIRVSTLFYVPVGGGTHTLGTASFIACIPLLLLAPDGWPQVSQSNRSVTFLSLAG